MGSSFEIVDGVLGLVDLNPWRFWTRFSMIVASVDGQYLFALASVIPVHDD